MGAQHAPGPWRVHVEHENNHGRTKSVYVCTEEAWPEGQLARVNLMDGLCEREANARLIAASPELLDTIETLLKKHAAHHNSVEHAAARALLRKIRGVA